jgi:hypothetical protein
VYKCGESRGRWIIKTLQTCRKARPFFSLKFYLKNLTQAKEKKCEDAVIKNELPKAKLRERYGYGWIDQLHLKLEDI